MFGKRLMAAAAVGVFAVLLAAAPANAAVVAEYEGTRSCGDTYMDIRSTTTNMGGGTFQVWHQTKSGATQTSLQRWYTSGYHYTLTPVSSGTWKIHSDNGQFNTSNSFGACSRIVKP